MFFPCHSYIWSHDSLHHVFYLNEELWTNAALQFTLQHFSHLCDHFFFLSFGLLFLFLWEKVTNYWFFIYFLGIMLKKSLHFHKIWSPVTHFSLSKGLFAWHNLSAAWKSFYSLSLTGKKRMGNSSEIDLLTEK